MNFKTHKRTHKKVNDENIIKEIVESAHQLHITLQKV